MSDKKKLNVFKSLFCCCVLNLLLIKMTACVFKYVDRNILTVFMIKCAMLHVENWIHALFPFLITMAFMYFVQYV